MGSLLFAWLCASGGLLDVAQVFAWVRMCSGYVQTMPLSAAVAQTLDPEKPCEICRAVLKARQGSSESEKAPSETSVEVKEVVLIAPRIEPIVLSPSPEAWPAWTQEVAETRTDPVPVPPPRGRAAWFCV